MEESEYDNAIQSVDKILKPLLVLTVIYVIVIMTVIAWKVFVVANKIDNNVSQTQTIINNNQAGALQARKDNIQRSDESKGYIKCLLLLKYDRPDITPASSRADTEAALDNCAKSTTK